MKVIDPKSMLIGILITLLVFSTLGLRPKTDELGHLVVRSLTIEDDRGVIMGYLGNGYMMNLHMLALAGWEADTSGPIIILKKKLHILVQAQITLGS